MWANIKRRSPTTLCNEHHRDGRVLFLAIGPDGIGLCGKIAIALRVFDWIGPPIDSLHQTKKINTRRKPLRRRTRDASTLIQIATYSIRSSRSSEVSMSPPVHSSVSLYCRVIRSIFDTRATVPSIHQYKRPLLLFRLYNHSTRAKSNSPLFFYAKPFVAFLIQFFFLFSRIPLSIRNWW